MIWIEFADNGNVRFWTADSNAAVLRWGAKADDYAYQKADAEPPDERQRKIAALITRLRGAAEAAYRAADNYQDRALSEERLIALNDLATAIEAGEHMKEQG